MVEQRPFKPLVGGSSPPAPTTFFPSENAFFLRAKKTKYSPVSHVVTESPTALYLCVMDRLTLLATPTTQGGTNSA